MSNISIRSRFGLRTAQAATTQITATLALVLIAFAAPAQAVPVITSVSGCSDSGPETLDCPTSGGVSISIFGIGFGIGTTVAAVGGNACITSNNATDTLHVCTLPEGAGTNLAVVVSDGVTPSTPAFSVSYAAPSISSVTGCSGGDGTGCARVGGDIITIAGSDFGAGGFDVTVGGAPCASPTTVVPHAEITCELPPGAGSAKPVIVTQSGQSSNSGSISYVPCPVGTSISGFSCVPCEPGTFSAVQDATSCTPCSPGTSNASSGQSECTECPIGRFQSSAGASTCLDCDPGSAQPATGSISCESCVPGTVSPSSGQATCIDCPPGRFQPASGQAACLLCAVGTEQPNTGSVSCDPCPEGTANPVSGQTACPDCSPGFFQAATGQTTCLQCDPGTAQPSSGANSCAPCAPGEFQPASGQSTCQACPLGRFQDTSGSTTCQDCSPGRFADTAGSTLCENCPQGTSQPNSAAADCDDCTAGTFQLNTGSTTCEDCPGGQVTPCTDNGSCSDGPTGDGICTCDLGYEGVACDTCAAGFMPDGPDCVAVTTTTTTMTGDCSTTPLASCLSAGLAKLLIKAPADPAKAKLKWQWKKGDTFGHVALGDPLGSTAYSLCIYDSVLSAPQPATALVVQASAAWQDKNPKGWQYKDKPGTQDGVTKIKLKPGAATKTLAQFQAKGASTPTGSPAGVTFFNQDPTVTAQLVSSAGLCWTAEFDATSVKKHTVDQFKAVVK